MILRHRFAIPLPRFVKESIGSQNTTAWYRRDLAAYPGVRSPSSHFLVFLTFFLVSVVILFSSPSPRLLSSSFSLASPLSTLLLIFLLLFSLIFLAVPFRRSTDLKSHLQRKLHRNSAVPSILITFQIRQHSLFLPFLILLFHIIMSEEKKVDFNMISADYYRNLGTFVKKTSHIYKIIYLYYHTNYFSSLLAL